VAGESKKEQKPIEEFYEWKKALKILGYLLKLEDFEIKCKEENCKIIIEQVNLNVNPNDNSPLPLLTCEADVEGKQEINSLKLFFIPIEFSISEYGFKNIYPIFKEEDLSDIKKVLEKLDKHFKIGKEIYELLKEEKYIVFFLIYSKAREEKHEILSSTRSCIPIDSEIIKQYLRNPPFMHILNPIFKGELIWIEKEEAPKKVPVSNIINWSDEWKKIKENIKALIEYIVNHIGIEKFKEINELKRKYYSIFVEPYIKIHGKYSNDKKENINLNLKEIMEIFDTVYKQSSENRRHRTPVDFLRTPVPFCFWDFIRKLYYVRKNLNLKEDNKLRILWIDNNASSGEEEKLKDILKQLLALKEEEIDIKPVKPNEINELRNSNFSLEKYKPHIILLDFFLDNEDITVASWFIEELFKRIKNKGITYWVMIVSRYTPAVVKYLESGFLGGYYPNAFVYLGDFWKKDEKDKDDFNIIFAYKFIDLLESKIRFIKDIEKELEEYIDNHLRNEGNNDTDLIKNLILKLRIFLSEIEINEIGNIIQLKYSKEVYNLLYSYIIYKSVLPETERDLINELKRRILYETKNGGDNK